MNRAKFIVAPKGIIINNGKVLLIKRQYDNTDGGSWEFVGGSMEYGENPIVALRREIYEETSLTDISILDILYASMANERVTIITYLCESKTQNIILSDEHVDYCWVDKQDLIKLVPQIILNDLIENDVLSRI